MLRPYVLITIQQIPSERWPNRNKLIEIDFVNEYEIESTWENHTDNAAIRLPKNIVLKTELEAGGSVEEFLFRQSGTYNVVIGGSVDMTDSIGSILNIPPLIQRGDVVTISDGYRYKNEAGDNQKVFQEVFKGFISRISSEIPIEIECEDNFFLLKRTPVNKSLFDGNLVDLCKYLVDQTNSLFGLNTKYSGTRQVGETIENGVSIPTYEDSNPYPKLLFTSEIDELTANFSLGHLDIGNVTCAELLNRLRTQYKIDSFFVGNELHFGFPIYNEERANSKNFFEFQNNIFSDCDLKYISKQDIVLSAIVSCQSIRKTGRKTRDGADATKKERISVLIYWDIPSEEFKFQEKKKGEPFTKNEGGERHEFIYPIGPQDPEPSLQTLVEFGKNQLKKYFYDGFRGHFTTFGFPFVKWNDNVNIVDRVIADRNGQYKVKKVVRRGGADGIEQDIHLDFKQNIKLPQTTEKIYML